MFRLSMRAPEQLVSHMREGGGGIQMGNTPASAQGRHVEAAAQRSRVGWMKDQLVVECLLRAACPSQTGATHGRVRAAADIAQHPSDASRRKKKTKKKLRGGFPEMSTSAASTD